MSGGGQVLHSAPGLPGFPPRLAVELFERARLLAGADRVGLWDPMCGAGGIVAALALLRADALTRVLASDVSDRALELASKNLHLTTPEDWRPGDGSWPRSRQRPSGSSRRIDCWRRSTGQRRWRRTLHGRMRQTRRRSPVSTSTGSTS